jgi:hypothetical protein
MPGGYLTLILTQQHGGDEVGARRGMSILIPSFASFTLYDYWPFHGLILLDEGGRDALGVGGLGGGLVKDD